MYFNRIFIHVSLLLSLFGLVAWYDQLAGGQPEGARPVVARYYLMNGPQGRPAAMPPLQTLGTWTSMGFPSYLVSSVPDVIDGTLLKDIAFSLPESKKVPVYHPEYLANTAPSTIHVKELADVWITFVSEGAGWYNTLGFYTFDAANPPTRVDQIQNPTIIFPNVSRQGSGGMLLPGHKVKLGRFAAGTNIGFFLMADAFRNGQVGAGKYVHFSHEALNVEPSASLRRHVVVLDDSRSDRLLLGLEDIRRDSTGCDQDFNDAVFFMTSNPVKALDDPAFPKLEIDRPCVNVCVPIRVTRVK